MSRFARVGIVAGSALTFAACSEMAPTAPAAAPAGDVAVAASTAPSASCTVTPNGAGYDVTVAWSGLSVTSIDLWQVNGTQPLAHADLAQPTRKGSLTLTLTSAPDYAQVTGLQTGFKVVCSTAV